MRRTCVHICSVSLTFSQSAIKMAYVHNYTVRMRHRWNEIRASSLVDINISTQSKQVVAATGRHIGPLPVPLSPRLPVFPFFFWHFFSIFPTGSVRTIHILLCSSLPIYFMRLSARLHFRGGAALRTYRNGKEAGKIVAPEKRGEGVNIIKRGCQEVFNSCFSVPRNRKRTSRPTSGRHLWNFMRFINTMRERTSGKSTIKSRCMQSANLRLGSRRSRVEF